MLSSFVIFDTDVSAAIIPFTIGCVIIAIGFIVRKTIFISISRWAKTKAGDIIIDSIKTPSFLWLVMLAIYGGVAFSKLPPETVKTIGKLLFILGALSVTLAVTNLASRMLTIYSTKMSSALPGISLIDNVLRVIIFSAGILIILDRLDVSITPLLTALGVGGLAVALALQDTLTNLFAGFHISINQMLRVGDYVKLESGEEGYVVDITWRTTKIKMLANNFILVPNAKITQTIITNYYYPDKAMAVLVKVGVHYNSNLKDVERITCEVAKEIMREIPGGIPEFDPFIRYNEFADFSINFNVIMRGKEYVDQYIIRHEFIKKLHERYSKEGIVIPYPINAINYSQEDAK